MPSGIEQHGPKISVIIPTYNRAGYLRQALASILAQSWTPEEIIVVDDGSSDDTLQVVQDTPGPVQFYQQAHGGVAAARNLGLDKATGDLIAWLDSDDLWEPDFLATVVPLLSRDENLGGVYTGFTIIDAANAELKTSIHVEPPEKLWEALEQNCFILTSSFVARKSCYDQVDRFDPQLNISEDADMFYRLAGKFRIVGVPQPLVRYRVHDTNTMSDPDAFCQARMHLTRKRFGELQQKSDLSAATRAAYGQALRSIALKYLEHGREDDGWAYMSRSASLYPEILSQLDTFYELACGDQARGYRGHAKLLDIEANGRKMLGRLDLLLVDSPPDVQALRGIAFGQAYLALAMLSDQAGCWSNARNYLFYALRANPRLVVAPGVLRRLLKVTLLTPKAMTTMRSRRQPR